MQMPKGVGNAYAFQVFNTVSFTIVLSTPMFLYFKKLGASATVLGIVLALPNLLNILQIPAAQFVEKTGYRTFVLRGWVLRSACILGMAGVALLPETISPTMRIALLLFLLFAFNVSRGISFCAFLPWITQWIPAEVRGRYISRDQMSNSLATLGTMTLSTFFLRPPEPRFAYGFLFLGSFITAVISLWLLRRIPDVPVPLPAANQERKSWKEMLRYPPFCKLLVYNAVFLFGLAGGVVFWIPMLRDAFAASDSLIMGMTALWSAVAMVCLWGFGQLVDRVGSRPLLGFATLILVVHFGLWTVLAAHVLPLNLATIFLIQLTSGIGIPLFNLANTRLLMVTVPPLGRSHFFALYTVVTSLISGGLPIFWGILLDALGGWNGAWSRWQWNQYSLLYSMLIVIMIIALMLRNHLSEERAMTTDGFVRELLVETPRRAMSRLFARRPPAPSADEETR